jgi:diguanylate cyclase
MHWFKSYLQGLRWRPRRLATRLVLVLAASGVPALVAAFGWLSWRSYSGLQEAVRAEIAVQAAITANNTAASLAFGNPGEAQAVLQSIGLSPHIISATLFDKGGKAFAAYDKGGSRSAALAADGLFRVEAPVLVGGENIGRITVVGHFGAIWADFKRDLGKMTGVLLAVMAAAMLIGWQLAMRVTRPIGLLAALMDRITQERNYALRAEVHGNDEIARLARHFNAMLSRVEHHDASLSAELVQRERAEREYAELAYRDPVTGLPNRRYFTEELERQLVMARASSSALALLFVDLDNFKGVNDTLGHDAGDQLLREIALGLKDALRDEDIVCRLGGDEFAVMITEVQEHTPMERILDKLGAAARRGVSLQGSEVSVSASIGVAIYPHAGLDSSNLLRNADTAMYHAKASGKDRSVVFSPELLQSATREFLIRTTLPRAIERGELLLHYQPIVNLADARAVKVEALLRWHSASGRYSPAEFIPIAEESGAIVAIGDWVVEESCRQLAQWKTQGLRLTMSVNVSARQLRDLDFSRRVQASLQRHGILASELEIELTESQMLGFDSATTAALAALEALGLRLVIDDFGAGFSSLAYLSRLAIDGIKVDRALIEDLGRSEGRAVASAILAMARSLGLETVAEGVETEEQAQALRSLGFQQAQGYLFSKPCAASELVAKLAGAFTSAALLPLAAPEHLHRATP